MKKNDLKLLIKPLVQECIQEILIEEGLLSTVVAEVAKGLQGNLVLETPTPKSPPITETPVPQRRAPSNQRKELREIIGANAYNGVDLFEGTTPTRQAPAKGHADLGDPQDAGVDISALVGNASQVWRSIK
tara:strand:+ start:1206 stop:1598 length:393 start_codon:yes stop_codon:yes gene_type:complete